MHISDLTKSMSCRGVQLPIGTLKSFDQRRRCLRIAELSERGSYPAPNLPAVIVQAFILTCLQQKVWLAPLSRPRMGENKVRCNSHHAKCTSTGVR